MTQVWMLNDKDIYLDENNGNEDTDEELICTCIGRGKRFQDLVLPRMPNLQFEFITIDQRPESPLTYTSTDSVNSDVDKPIRSGRGRAKLLKQRLEKVGRLQNISQNCRLPNGRVGLNGPGKPNISAQAVESVIRNDIPKVDDDMKTDHNVENGLSLEEFPVLASPKRKGNKNISDIDTNVIPSPKKLSLNSLSDNILRYDDSDKNMSVITNVPLSESEETLVFGDDLDMELEELLSKTDERSQKINPCTDQSKKEPFSHSMDQNDLDMCGVKDWTLDGCNVIQCDGLPVKCNISELEDLIASFGKIVDKEKIVVGDSLSVRFRLGTSDACDWVVSCLHDSDCVYPDSNRVLVCFRIEEES